MSIVLIYFAVKYKGDWNQIFKALENREVVPVKEASKLEEEIKVSKWSVKTIVDRDYPNKLKSAYKPPFVIWIKGDYQLLENKTIALTGDIYDQIAQKRLDTHIESYKSDYSIIGRDINRLDQKINELSKNNIYVVASGLDKFKYQNYVLLISEYPFGTPASPETFRARNRIVASLGDKLVLVNSKKNSKINHLVSSFLNLGKDIYAYPGDGFEDDGNSELIKQGAYLITSSKDLN